MLAKTFGNSFSSVRKNIILPYIINICLTKSLCKVVKLIMMDILFIILPYIINICLTKSLFIIKINYLNLFQKI